MAIYGLIGLLVSFAGTLVAVVCLALGSFLSRKKTTDNAETLMWGGHIAAVLGFIGLTFCCGLLVFCFVSGDTSIEYVVRSSSHQTGPMGLLFRIAGLWEGREGSLMFWAWLIALFNFIIALRNMKKLDRLDATALLVGQLVLVGFVGILLLSEDNNPFKAMAAEYFDAQGNLQGAAAIWGMNALLEHWAMAVHPPALFIGYAGLTVPFCYAIATLIVGDSSDEWVRKSERYTMVAWWFLGLGIGLGSIWAYVVLGWGGYWGWDAVENASLLPWLVGVALIHSFTVYRKRGAFKRWSIMCACIAFAFVVTGTFISRSGLIESVHAFSGDTVSLYLFGALIVLSLLAGIVGLALRWKRFAPKNQSDEDVESFMSRDAAYYFNNVIMVVFACLVCYLTVAQALPSWLPFGGRALTAATYNAVARPMGILYCLVLAVCPLLGWQKTDRAEFLAKFKLPAICAGVLFVVLFIYWLLVLCPAYDTVIAAGGTNAAGLESEGPAIYYKGLALIGLAVASLVFFNTLFMIARRVGRWASAHDMNPVRAFGHLLVHQSSTFGGYIAHLSIAVILVGLIGSSMFVIEKTGYVVPEDHSGLSSTFQIEDYTLVYTGDSITTTDEAPDVYYTVEFDVYRGDTFVGHVAPNMRLIKNTQQTTSNAAIVGFPDEDLFVVYKGVNDAGAFSMDVRVNPMIRPVWIGFIMLLLGTAVAALGHRKRPNGCPAKKSTNTTGDADVANAEVKSASAAEQN